MRTGRCVVCPCILGRTYVHLLSRGPEVGDEPVLGRLGARVAVEIFSRRWCVSVRLGASRCVCPSWGPWAYCGFVTCGRGLSKEPRPPSHRVCPSEPVLTEEGPSRHPDTHGNTTRYVGPLNLRRLTEHPVPTTCLGDGTTHRVPTHGPRRSFLPTLRSRLPLSCPVPTQTNKGRGSLEPVSGSGVDVHVDTDHEFGWSQYGKTRYEEGPVET